MERAPVIPCREMETLLRRKHAAVICNTKLSFTQIKCGPEELNENGVDLQDKEIGLSRPEKAPWFWPSYLVKMVLYPTDEEEQGHVPNPACPRA
jgi:hypothetical protein